MSGGGAPAAEPSGGGRRSVFGDAGAEDITLNLTALMDILSNLLFFLLASFGATIVMTINVTTPVQGAASDAPPPNSPDVITLNVHLTKTSLDVAATGNGQPADEIAAIKRSIPHVADAPDYGTFAEYLLTLKEKYPKSDTMILLPDPGVSYEHMIKVMDAAREKPLDAGGKLRMAALFPTVVVSTVVK